MISEKMQKNKNQIFFPAKLTPCWDLVSGAHDHNYRSDIVKVL